ncbi:glycoside hydrolase family 3 N-terminal domain-containing protein [Georgenia sp. MJ206]|uniref:glycoside hydrolase family 3 protein n=1 Tax=Georgenia wangjunii TaxID=3117730 RepID=UPI002F260953
MHSRPVRRAGVVAAAAAVLAASVVPAAAATPVPGSSTELEAAIDAMSVDELIGQMSFADVFGTAADSVHASNQTRYGVDTPAQVVEKYDLGGVLYFAQNITSPQQTALLSNGLQAASTGENGSGIPLAVTIDQEGGTVARLQAPATVLPGAMALGASNSPQLARAQGEVLGAEMAAIGVNVNFAPVADLNTNPANPVINVRSLGADPARVGPMVVAQVEGMQSQGIAAAAKHFPGHGDTSVDSHTGLPTVTYDRATLEQHLVPFQQAIDAGVDMIMTAHIIVEAIDPELPGTLSPAVLTDLLREEMGFDGLITTDALNMAALKQVEGPDGELLDDYDIAAMSIVAGADILLFSPDLDASIAGIKAAMDRGEITRERLEESVRRILEWKIERGVWDADPMVDVDAVPTVVGKASHQVVANSISDRAVTLLRNRYDLLPLDPEADSVLMVGAGSAWPERMGPMLRERGFTVTEDYENGGSPSAAYRDRAVAAAADHDVVVFASNNANAAQRQMVEALAATDTPVVVIATRNPYDINGMPGADAVLNTYGVQVINFYGAVRALAGDINPSGTLPVAVPTANGSGVLFPVGHGLRYPTNIRPAAVAFTDALGTAEDTFMIPAVEGVEYLVDGEVLAAGTYPATGTVTVTARATDGYTLASGATTEWTHVFDASGVSVTAETRCVVGRVVQVARVTNTTGTAAQVTVTGNYGSRTATVAAGASTSVTFSSRLGSVPAGDVAVDATVGDQAQTVSAVYTARSCA